MKKKANEMKKLNQIKPNQPIFAPSRTGHRWPQNRSGLAKLVPGAPFNSPYRGGTGIRPPDPLFRQARVAKTIHSHRFPSIPRFFWILFYLTMEGYWRAASSRRGENTKAHERKIQVNPT